MTPLDIILLLASFLIALSIHEFSHAWVADKLGDPNPKLAGRLSLNPLVHLDPIGTVLLPLIMILTGFPIVFGWAKPVEIDIFNFKNLRKDAGLVSLAGPVANLLMAIIISLFLRITPFLIFPVSLIKLLFSLIQINVGLALFNIIPIHPLDGGKILVGFLPPQSANEVDDFLNRYGQFLLLILIFPFFGYSLISQVLTPVINLLLSILLPSMPLV